jgi:glutamate-1-semialdehyde aminotransferase
VNDFYSQLQTIFDEANFPAIVQGLGCTFGIYVGTREPVTNYHHITERTDPELRKAFFLKCIEKGLFFHTDFTISAQHDEALLSQSLVLLREAVRETKKAMQRR